MKTTTRMQRRWPRGATTMRRLRRNMERRNPKWCVAHVLNPMP